MNINIQADGFVVDQKLTELLNTKLSKLTTYFDKIIDVSVKLSLDSHSKIKDKVVHILCHIPNAKLFVESTAKTFEEAADDSVEDLKRQIKKRKELMSSAKGKGVRFIDDILATED